MRGEWTRETWNAIAAADIRRTRAWCDATTALATTPDLGAAISAYNQIMLPADQRWKQECANAIALSEDDTF